MYRNIIEDLAINSMLQIDFEYDNGETLDCGISSKSKANTPWIPYEAMLRQEFYFVNKRYDIECDNAYHSDHVKEANDEAQDLNYNKNTTCATMEIRLDDTGAREISSSSEAKLSRTDISKNETDNDSDNKKIEEGQAISEKDKCDQVHLKFSASVDSNKVNENTTCNSSILHKPEGAELNENVYDSLCALEKYDAFCIKLNQSSRNVEGEKRNEATKDRGVEYIDLSLFHGKSCSDMDESDTDFEEQQVQENYVELAKVNANFNENIVNDEATKSLSLLTSLKSEQESELKTVCNSNTELESDSNSLFSNEKDSENETEALSHCFLTSSHFRVKKEPGDEMLKTVRCENSPENLRRENNLLKLASATNSAVSTVKREYSAHIALDKRKTHESALMNPRLSNIQKDIVEVKNTNCVTAEFDNSSWEQCPIPKKKVNRSISSDHSVSKKENRRNQGVLTQSLSSGFHVGVPSKKRYRNSVPKWMKDPPKEACDSKYINKKKYMWCSCCERWNLSHLTGACRFLRKSAYEYDYKYF